MFYLFKICLVLFNNKNETHIKCVKIIIVVIINKSKHFFSFHLDDNILPRKFMHVNTFLKIFSCQDTINSVKTHAFADLLMQMLAYCSVFPFPFKTFVLWGPQLSLYCLSTLRTTPIADIKTSKLVEPAEINDNGKHVWGIRPLNIS